MGQGSEVLAPCTPLRTGLDSPGMEPGWGRRPAAAWSPSLPALPPPSGPGRLSRSLRNVTRPGVRGGWEASAPACQLSLWPLAQLPSHRGGPGRQETVCPGSHQWPRGQQNQLCWSSGLRMSTFNKDSLGLYLCGGSGLPYWVRPEVASGTERAEPRALGKGAEPTAPLVIGQLRIARKPQPTRRPAHSPVPPCLTPLWTNQALARQSICPLASTSASAIPCN